MEDDGIEREHERDGGEIREKNKRLQVCKSQILK